MKFFERDPRKVYDAAEAAATKAAQAHQEEIERYNTDPDEKLRAKLYAEREKTKQYLDKLIGKARDEADTLDDEYQGHLETEDGIVDEIEGLTAKLRDAKTRLQAAEEKTERFRTEKLNVPHESEITELTDDDVAEDPAA